MVQTISQFEFLLVGGDLAALKYFQHQRAYQYVLYGARQKCGQFEWGQNQEDKGL